MSPREQAGRQHANEHVSQVSQRVEQVRTVRRRLAAEGPPRTREHPGDFERVAVPDGDGDQIRDLLIAEQATTVIEIGLGYASSALAIGEALLSVGGAPPTHVVIDAFQSSDYADVGWELLRAAGLDEICTLVAERSQTALAELVTDGLTADAAFVDGSHLFHNVFVDLHFLGQLVRPGGLLVLDDHWWPSVATAARYFERNLDWQPIAGAFDGATVDPATGRPRLRALRLPDPPVHRGFENFRPFG